VRRPTSGGERLSGRQVGHERPEEPRDLRQVVLPRGRVDGPVEVLLDLGNLSRDPNPLLGEGQLDVPAVVGRDLAAYELDRDEAVDQPAGTIAALADEQVAEAGQGERLAFLQQPDHLGLGGRDAQRVQGAGEHPVSFSLRGEDQKPEFFSRTHGERFLLRG
jgi:hypothetical protein